MSELADCVIETLREDGEFLISRVRREDDPRPRLLVSPALERPAPESLERLKHAYSLRDELNPSWATQPGGLVSHRGRAALLLHDPGGEFLDGLIAPGAKSPAHHHARSAFIYAYVPSDEKICTGNSVRYDRSK